MIRRMEWIDVRSLEEAVALLKAHGPAAVLLAGGGDLVPWLRQGEPGPSARPPRVVVNLASVPGLDAVAYERGTGHRLGAMVTVALLADDRTIRERHRGIAQAAGEVGSPAVRATATLGGNLCQRPRCAYFRQRDASCLRHGGAGCPAVDGDHRYHHAILEGGACVTAHPSDLAPALIAAEATVAVVGEAGRRTMTLERFFAAAGDDPTRDNALAPGEVLAEVHVPEPPPGTRSVFLKARMAPGWDFALASAAVSLRLRGEAVREVRIVLGGVAPRPYRALRAEAALRGHPLSAATLRAAAEIALAPARPLRLNAYKVDLAQSLLQRALVQAAGGAVAPGPDLLATPAPTSRCHSPKGPVRCRGCTCTRYRFTD